MQRVVELKQLEKQTVYRPIREKNTNHHVSRRKAIRP